MCSQKSQQEDDQQLDTTTSRTLDTLDYRYIIQASAEECGTVVAREIVWRSLDYDGDVSSYKKDRKRKRKDGADDNSIRSIS